jgi:hypothetical protein
VATSGESALRGGLSEPPGRHDSVTSFAATPKKKTMKMSFTT